MNLKNPEKWARYVEANADDPYGNACVVAAEKIMDQLAAGYNEPMERLLYGHGLSGFQAGAVAQMVSDCDMRGEEFRQEWNRATQISGEGDGANTKPGAVLNPALLVMEEKNG